jgi:hypothetical protein
MIVDEGVKNQLTVFPNENNVIKKGRCNCKSTDRVGLARGKAI